MQWSIKRILRTIPEIHRKSTFTIFRRISSSKWVCPNTCFAMVPKVHRSIIIFHMNGHLLEVSKDQTTGTGFFRIEFRTSSWSFRKSSPKLCRSMGESTEANPPTSWGPGSCWATTGGTPWILRFWPLVRWAPGRVSVGSKLGKPSFREVRNPLLATCKSLTYLLVSGRYPFTQYHVVRID